MGYYISYDIKASLDMSKQAEALAAINALHEPEALAANARCGSFSGGTCKGRWYSWVGNPGPEGFPDIFEAMRGWRFRLDKDGSLYWDGEKLGQEEILFKALAPFLFGEIYARGGDDSEWGYRFEDGKLINLQCVRTWVEE